MGSYPLSGNAYQSYGASAYPQDREQDNSARVKNNSSLGEDSPVFGGSPLTGAQDTRVFSPKQQQAAQSQKKGFFQKVGDFFKGIGNGIKNGITALLNPKNWPLIIGAVALCFFCPPAAAILAGVGAVVATGQIAKGIKNDDWEKVGEGALNLGLSAGGLRATTASVKNADGKFTATGTKTAEAEANVGKAEQNLATMKRENADPAEIGKAEASVSDARQGHQSALDHQARISTARMNFKSKNDFMKRTEANNLTPEQLSAKVAQSGDDMSAARATATEAELALKNAKASGTDLPKAQAAAQEARTNLAKATQQHLDALKAQRIQGLKEMGYGERSKTYLQDNWATSKDSWLILKGDTLTNAQGQTLNFWNRNAKDIGAADAAGAANADTMGSAFKSWWKPNRVPKTDESGKKNNIPIPASGNPLPPTDPNSASNASQFSITPPSGNPSSGKDAKAAALAAQASWQAVFNRAAVNNIPASSLADVDKGVMPVEAWGNNNGSPGSGGNSPQFNPWA